MVYDTYTNQKLTFVSKNRMNYIRIARRIILGLIIILGICIVASSVGAVNIPLTDNPWQVGHRNSFESFLNLTSNCSLSMAKVMAGMPQIIIKTDIPMKN